jgi:phosphatidylglycerophosphatase C
MVRKTLASVQHTFGGGELTGHQTLMDATNERLLVVLDLDGTITRADTLIPFLAGCFLRYPRLSLKLLLVPLDALMWLLGRIDNAKFKTKLLTAVMGGLPITAVDSWAHEFARNIAERGCRPEMLSLITRCRNRGDRLIILSASPDIYVRYIADELGVGETVCTRLEVGPWTFTGRLASPNCKGEEKLRRLKEHLGSEVYDGLTLAFGNEESDLSILEWAGQGWMLKGKSLMEVSSAGFRKC